MCAPLAYLNPRLMSSEELAQLRAELDSIQSKMTTLKDQGLVTVMERDQPNIACRFEALAENSAFIRQWAAHRVQPLVETIFGEAAFLFKDKLNFKSPGGGAYGPHQDFAAYRHFPPRGYLTAMIAVDPMEARNGCLEIAMNQPSVENDIPLFDSPGFDRSAQWLLLPQCEGGDKHGDIIPSIASLLRWQPLPLPAGGVALFDALLPHRSAINRSHARRRALFLTYNPASQGDHYRDYYARKRAAPQDPIFHVSTPTLRE